MKSRTTLWGAIAGASTAAQTIPELAGWPRVLLMLVAGIALGALGYHATECPANCPGTDQDGRPRVARGVSVAAGVLIVLALTAVIAFAALTSGCTALVAHSYLKEGSTNTAPKRGATLYGVSFFDSGPVLGKTRLTYESATNGQWAPAIGTAGWTQSASPTGTVMILQQFSGVAPLLAAPATAR